MLSALLKISIAKDLKINKAHANDRAPEHENSTEQVEAGVGFVAACGGHYATLYVSETVISAANVKCVDPSPSRRSGSVTSTSYHAARQTWRLAFAIAAATYPAGRCSNTPGGPPRAN